MRKTTVFTEQMDNIICTFVKLYRFNVTYGLTRASQYLGIKRTIVANRYYYHLRNTREIFSVQFGDRVIWNTRAISSKELESLSRFEKIVPETDFQSLENRAWWKDS